MRIRYAGRSDRGRVRSHNEDNLYINGYCRGPDRDDFTCPDTVTSEEPAFFVVCDGIGGGPSGEKASLLAVHEIRDRYSALAEEEILPMVRQVNRLVCDRLGIREGMEAGTTLTGLRLARNRFSLCNIGDSRVYLLRKGLLYRLTRDHTQARQMVDSGVITEEMADKSGARHVLTQYIGVPEDDFILSPQITAPADLEEEDRFLVCSDGLYEMVPDQRLRSILMEGGGPGDTAAALMEAALTGGGRDNITAIVVDIEEKTGVTESNG